MFLSGVRSSADAQATGGMPADGERAGRGSRYRRTVATEIPARAFWLGFQHSRG